MLKVNQSEACSCPALLMEENGKLKVKELEVEAMLKMLPAVPVAKVMAGPVAPLMEVIAEVK